MGEKSPRRRDFIHLATGAVAAFGAGSLAYAMGRTLSPAADSDIFKGVIIRVDLIPEGSELMVLVGTKPVVVRHRTQAEISAAQADDDADLPDPATDASRLKPMADGTLRPEYIVYGPPCTHSGCMTIAQAGDYDGRYCPCHGAHFDTSGRVRKGPAPWNLRVPSYYWVAENEIAMYPSPTSEEMHLIAMKRQKRRR